MKRPSAALLAVLAAGALGAEPRPAPRVDRATELMRREAEAAARQRRLMFDHIRVIEPPAPVMRLAPGVKLGAVDRFPGVVIQQEAASIRDPGDDDLGDDEAGAAPESLVPRRPSIVIPSDTFDRWIFGAADDADHWRGRLLETLDRELQSAEKSHVPATPAEQARLRLAGRGDIKRFFDRVDELRRESAAGMDPEAYAAFRRDLLTLRSHLTAGLFRQESLFAKTLDKLRADAAVRPERETKKE
jgi:hypothetical protein